MQNKVIVQYWNDRSLPSDIADLSKTWAENNTDINFSHIVFDRDMAADFIRSKYGFDIAKLFLNARLPAMQSDIFRVAYCLEEGGVYVDIGSKCNRNVSDLLSTSNNLILMRKWHGKICNGLIISESGNSMLAHIWQLIVQNISAKKVAKVWSLTGPENYIIASKKSEFQDIYNTVDQLSIKNVFELVGNKKRKGLEHWSNYDKQEDLYHQI